jgi:hypothetical protein
VSKHQDKDPRQIAAERIADRIAALVDPWSDVVTQRVPDVDGLRLVVRTTTVHHPSLLEQLANPEPGSTAGTGSSSPTARAAANLGGLAVIQDIDAAARIWLARIDGRWSHAGIVASLQGLGALAHKRPVEALRANVADILARLSATTEDRLRQIGRAAGMLPEEALWNLDRDVQGWWSHARVATTWGQPPLRPHVPCSECGAMGKLRVQTNPTSAVCIECGAAWDALTIGELGTQVQLLADHAAAEHAARLIEERPCARCGEVHALTPVDELHAVPVLAGATTRDKVATAGGDAMS